MTKAELVSAIARRTGLQKTQAKNAVDAFVASVTGELKAGKEVRLVGFGSFVPVERAARMARNPKTGAPVKSPAFKTARFKIGDSLRATLN
ncbi:MAG TPA: HU family DNA-binding protein [Caulobacteraceae bacterium]|jgi:DNA-binding protein HU-beta|nr:HU family DNA-binding protein [Caulobacteraceae bacterium]